MDSIETIGARLRRLRLERGFSQRELSGPGVSYAYISRIEAGTRQPSVKALRSLARKLRVSPEYLETGSELREVDSRELRLADAELALRLGGDPREVEARINEILVEAQRAGDTQSTRRAQIALGVAAFQRGDYATVVATLEPLADPEVLSPRNYPDVYTTLARAWVGLGSVGRDVDLFERCLKVIPDDDDISAIRFATQLSYAYLDLGDSERARKVVESALERGERASDLYSQVRLHWSAARVNAQSGRELDGLKHIRRAIALLEATEDSLYLGRANVLAASILLESQEDGLAARHLETAARLLGAAPEPSDLSTLRTLQARVAARQGEPDEAIALATEALDLPGTDPTEQASASLALAEAYATQGRIDEATKTFASSVELYCDASRYREAAAAARSWAKALRQAGREQEAFDVLERAADLAGQVGSVTPR